MMKVVKYETYLQYRFFSIEISIIVAYIMFMYNLQKLWKVVYFNNSTF
jgi:hypothetical protein